MAHNGDNNRSNAPHDHHHHRHHHHGDIPPSPSHFGFPGTFLAEDLHELLGAIREEHEVATAGTAHFPGSFSANSVASVSNSLSHEPNNNRASNNNDDDDNGATSPTLPGDCAKAQARSERKRSRERQRRSDVNKQFSDLTELLRKIEAEDQASETGEGATSKATAAAASSASRFSFSPANRVDLIAKTITVLERLHATSQKRKRTVVELQEELERTKKAGEDAAARLKQVGTMYSVGGNNNNNKIMMMVPMMVSSDGSSSAGTAFTMPHPFMQHAAYCPMPQPQPPASAPAAGDSGSATNHPLHHSTSNQMQQSGVASAASAPASSSHPYPHHQHHASYPSFLSMVPAAAANTAPAPYMFHPGMAQAMPMALHPDHMTAAVSHGMHGNPAFQVPVNTSMSNQQYSNSSGNGNTRNDHPSTSPDATAQQEAKVASGPLSTGGNLAHCA